ncbi:MAG: hypothetical protein HJJLKODD_01599 [Phycisphaerae bacterium]|nr:hypothetical protein [Phycisphaerae bacterium]
MRTKDTPLRQLLNRHTVSGDPAVVHPAPTTDHPQALRCLACGHRCFLPEGRHGVCHVRFNRDGVLQVPAHYVAALQVDPIEKKPFYHVFPGSEALSFGMMGCDLHCDYCQNWVTSQALRDDRAVARISSVKPVELVELALRHQAPVMVSTYNEPLITVEWAVEVFRLAREHGIVCGFVSNGHATPEVLEFIRPWVDLYKVDLKAFNDRTYRELGGVLPNVLDTIRRLHQMDFWVEIVTLIVPGLNDSPAELRQIADFIAGVSVDIPWHVTAFHPDYQMQEPPRTAAETLLRAYELGRAAGLRYVYAGNLPGQVNHTENTYCPKCDTCLIQRWGFEILANELREGCCLNCSTRLPGRWTPLAQPLAAMHTSPPLANHRPRTGPFRPRPAL